MNQRDVFLAGAGYTPPRRRKSRKVKNINDLKKENLKNALSAFGNNRRKAAERLGISLRTLYRWMSKWH